MEFTRGYFSLFKEGLSSIYLAINYKLTKILKNF
jgi:hypothetical protein